MFCVYTWVLFPTLTSVIFFTKRSVWWPLYACLLQSARVNIWWCNLLCWHFPLFFQLKESPTCYFQCILGQDALSKCLEINKFKKLTTQYDNTALNCNKTLTLKQRISVQVLALSLPNYKVEQGISVPVKYNNNSIHFLGLLWRLKVN